MTPKFLVSALALLALLVVGTSVTSAQSLPPAGAATQAATTICGAPVPEPANLPAEGSGPVVYFIAPCFPAQGNVSSVEPQTYLYYMQLRPSQPSQNIWVPWDEQAQRTAIADHSRLWVTNFLSNLSIEATDYTFSNGVIGKLVTYNMEERQRVKIVNYDGTSAIDRADIDEQLRARGIEMRLDAFVDASTIRRIETVLRGMMAEEGFTEADVSHEVTEIAGGPKLVNVTFQISDGPKIKIRDIEFVGNVAKTDGTLQGKMKNNKTPGFFGFITRGGTYKAGLFEEDADMVQAYYRNEGYVEAQIGQPEIKVLEETADGETRWVQLIIPVDEGERFRVGSFSIEGNQIVRSEVLEPIFEVTVGDWYSEDDVREGLVQAQEVYGAGGYMEFTGFPDITPTNDGSAAVPEAIAAPPSGEPPTVDVTMRLQEGEQYLVNRLTFVGNTTTRDNVIRREMRLVEGSVFNTEALKYSVRRLNQLGYFEQINEEDQTAMQVEKVPGRDDAVDVTVMLTEQNRNQLTFGAGVSQYEGVFGQLGFMTANFLGRGESLNVSAQKGNRSQNYQLSFTEPFLFDRNITGGFDVYKRALRFIGFYTQRTTGANVTVGLPVADFSRMFFNYSNEQTQMSDLNERFLDPNCVFRDGGCGDVSLTDLSTISPDVLEGLRRNPFIFDSLLIGEGGSRTVSKVTPSFVHNTVDNPIFPNTGRKITMAIDLAVLGGNTQFYKPSIEAVQFLRHTSRTTLGVRGQFQFIAPLRDTKTLPIFEKLVSGGEYSVRGYDIRSIGPADPATGLVLGGNKSLVFNAEYMISIVSQVRLIAFYDAAQVVSERQSLALRHFRTSTGAEIRFFMPVLNVPFRLIFAMNPQREGVLDNRFQPAKSFVFRFAVGSTF